MRPVSFKVKHKPLRFGWKHYFVRNIVSGHFSLRAISYEKNEIYGNEMGSD